MLTQWNTDILHITICISHPAFLRANPKSEVPPPDSRGPERHRLPALQSVGLDPPRPVLHLQGAAPGAVPLSRRKGTLEVQNGNVGASRKYTGT